MVKGSITLERAQAAKSKALRRFAKIPGLNGVGLTKRGSSFALKVNFEEMPSAKIPGEIDGVEVIVERVGPIRKLATKRAARAYHVVPCEGGWAVETRHQGAALATQREAVEAARKLSDRAAGEIVVHRRDGSPRD